jgi:hypothetical protein
MQKGRFARHVGPRHHDAPGIHTDRVGNRPFKQGMHHVLRPKCASVLCHDRGGAAGSLAPVLCHARQGVDRAHDGVRGFQVLHEPEQPVERIKVGGHLEEEQDLHEIECELHHVSGKSRLGGVKKRAPLEPLEAGKQTGQCAALFPDRRNVEGGKPPRGGDERVVIAVVRGFRGDWCLVAKVHDEVHKRDRGNEDEPLQPEKDDRYEGERGGGSQNEKKKRLRSIIMEPT